MLIYFITNAANCSCFLYNKIATYFQAAVFLYLTAPAFKQKNTFSLKLYLFAPSKVANNPSWPALHLYNLYRFYFVYLNLYHITFYINKDTKYMRLVVVRYHHICFYKCS